MKRLLIAIAAMCMVASCSKDGTDDFTPQTVKEFVTLGTDITGTPAYIIEDTGNTYQITEAHYTPELAPNSQYRVVLEYEITSRPSNDNPGQAESYAFNSVFVSPVVPLGQFLESIRQDPVKVTRIWQRGRYINMELGIKAKDRQHRFLYLERQHGFKDGTSELALYHDANNDTPAFTQTAYLSVPLDNTVTRYSPDSVAITINTYDGMQRFVYYIGDMEE
ncbi:MAG TPA: NigD-like N-terminal domain-containing protein [Candidatus Avibacteroides excrementipullorum]|jgi:hypothetical protein|nr:NigD-like N-terminal domain-containing protein [Candidatus Avibacteroides excrementipullorum]